MKRKSVIEVGKHANVYTKIRIKTRTVSVLFIKLTMIFNLL